MRCGVHLAARLDRILNVQTSTQLHAYANRDRAVRNWTRLPLAVSGAFSTDHATMTSTNWDTVIVGRSIGDAVHIEHQRGPGLTQPQLTPAVAARLRTRLAHPIVAATRGPPSPAVQPPMMKG